MRAIKIDVESKTIVEIEINKKESLKEMQAVVGGLIQPAFELENGDTIFVNEEGLLNNPQCFFELDGSALFAGNSIIVGTDYKTGKSKDAEASISDVKSKIRFIGIRELIIRYRKNNSYLS